MFQVQVLNHLLNFRQKWVRPDPPLRPLMFEEWVRKEMFKNLLFKNIVRFQDLLRLWILLDDRYSLLLMLTENLL